jgi:molecular chaperone DnaK (HSP70)
VIVGEYVKNQGARVPGRMVTSAKSWLCHAGVDRAARILPWGAPEGVRRISPVQTSSLYLAHLRAAWDHAFPDAPLADQDVVLTVPASFDEVARALTVEAAREAGLVHLTLVEEPQAAFYHFTAQHRTRLRQALGQNRLLLVCDVGGGTSDFTLIHATFDGEEPVLRRIAVGDHILLGGDNIDVTLARQVEARLGRRFDAAQWSMLVQACLLVRPHAAQSSKRVGGCNRTRVRPAADGVRGQGVG